MWGHTATMQEMRKVAWLTTALYTPLHCRVLCTHAMTTEHFNGMHYRLPALAHKVSDMITHGQMIGYCDTEGLYLRHTMNLR